MSAAPVECEGAPRELGFAQGRALAGAIRDRLAREGLRVRRAWPWPRRFAGGATLGAGMGREIVRHYPHLAERMAGLASGARLPVDVLMELHVLCGYESERFTPGARHSVLAACVRDGHAQLLASLGWAAAPGARWSMRRSKPEVGFASLEIAQPWAVSGVAGVNEAGLAVALGARVEPDERGSILPPAQLLVQECLQRFDRIEAAVEWCGKRPARSGASLVLADGQGRVVQVSLLSAGLKVSEPENGLLVSATDAACARALRQQLEAGAEFEPSLIVKALGQRDGSGAATADDLDQVWIEPAARELQLRSQAAL